MARPLLAGWLLVVAVLTLRNDPAAAARVAETPWSCILCGDAGGTDFVLNLLLFLPFGLLARAAGWRLGRLALCALALTIAIEVTQGTLLVGRDAALGDVVANTAGAMVGWWLFPGSWR